LWHDTPLIIQLALLIWRLSGKVETSRLLVETNIEICGGSWKAEEEGATGAKLKWS
jgi:hypothetical protein